MRDYLRSLALATRNSNEAKLSNACIVNAEISKPSKTLNWKALKMAKDEADAKTILGNITSGER